MLEILQGRTSRLAAAYCRGLGGSEPISRSNTMTMNPKPYKTPNETKVRPTPRGWRPRTAAGWAAPSPSQIICF